MPTNDCDICEGLGWVSASVPVGDPAFGRLQPCACRVSEHAAYLQRVCGLTDYERTIRLGDIVGAGAATAQALDLSRQFVDRGWGMLTLWGGPGNGKTMLLQGIVNESIERGTVAIYLTMYDLFQYVREGFNPDASIPSQVRYRRIVEAPIVCIDEVDKVKISEWAAELRTAFFDARYRQALDRNAGTVLAMNGDPEQMPDWIYSRLRDGRFKFGDVAPVVHNGDPDMRASL